MANRELSPEMIEAARRWVEAHPPSPETQAAVAKIAMSARPILDDLRRRRDNTS